MGAVLGIGLLAVVMAASFAVYWRTSIIAFLFLASGATLVFLGVVHPSLGDYLLPMSLGVTGWGYARILTVDYERWVSRRPVWLKGSQGATVREEAIPFWRTLRFVGFHLLLAFLAGWRRHWFTAGVLVLFAAQIVLAHAVYRGPRMSRA